MAHVHRFRKIPLGQTKGLWLCSPDPGEICYFYVYAKNEKFILRFPSRCWTCQQPFRLFDINLLFSMPTCPDCYQKMLIEERTRNAHP